MYWAYRIPAITIANLKQFKMVRAKQEIRSKPRTKTRVQNRTRSMIRSMILSRSLRAVTLVP